MGLGNDGALAFLEESVRVLETTHDKVRQKDAHLALAGAYETLGDPVRALTCFRTSYQLERTLHSQQIDQKMKVITARLELQRLRDEAVHERQARQTLSEINEELARTVGKLEQANRALEKLTEQLWQQANTDALTGLLNRSAFIRILEQKILALQEQEGSFFVVFLDLDDFKSVNDRFGHDVGDRLLIVVAERIRQALPLAATIARLSGDEFMVLLDGSNEVEPVNTVLNALNQPVEISGHHLRISASAGWSGYPSSGQNVNSLMIQADHAMYQAKRLGKGRAQKAAISNVDSSA